MPCHTCGVQKIAIFLLIADKAVTPFGTTFAKLADLCAGDSPLCLPSCCGMLGFHMSTTASGCYTGYGELKLCVHTCVLGTLCTGPLS